MTAPAALEAIITIGFDHLVRDWSHGAEALYGWSRDEAVGRRVYELVSPWVDAAHFDALVDALREKDTLSLEAARVRKDGRRLVVAVTLTLQRNERGAPVAIVATTRLVSGGLDPIDEARLTDLGQRMNELELVIGEGGELISVSDRACEVYGYAREELLLLNLRDLRAPSTLPTLPEQLARALERSVRFETRHCRRDGSEFPVEVSARPFRIGERRYTHSLVRDLTEQRRLMRDQRLLASLVTSMDDAVIVTTDAFVITEFTGRAEVMMGVSRAEVLGRDLFACFELELPDDSWSLAKPRLVERRPVRFRARLLRGRDWVELDVSLGPLGQNEGGWLLVGRDISAQVAAEARLAAESAYTRSLVEANLDPLVTLDAAGRITDVNRATEQLLHRTRDELMSAPFHTLFTEPGSARAFFEQVRAKGQVTDWPLEPLTPEQGRRALLFNGTELPSTTMSGRVVATARDVTAIRQAQSSLAEASRAAKTANELKSQFLANMSHEIRTPLNAVIGLARLGLDEENGARLKEYLELIHRSGTSLVELINDILDFSKIEAGKLVVESAPFRLRTLLRDLHDTFEPAAESRGLHLGVSVSPELPEFIMGDPLRVRQVVSNLLSNALKFTVAGRVDVLVEQEDEELVMRVRDTGIGISAEQAARLFESFMQADASTTRRYGGTGLGLAISRQLAQLMNGSLCLESSQGAGATFTFRSPLRTPSAEALREVMAREQTTKTREVPSTLAGRRVLLVEDNKVNQLLGRTLLQKARMVVSVAENGHQAVAALMSPDATFDVVLMDVQMPEMDGLEATRVVRERLGARCPPIIAMTANAMPEDRARSLAVGMVEHLAKPIDVDALYSLLRRVLNA